MGYDSVKDFNGRKYTGMTVGGRHTWVYPNGIWREQKVAPEEWEFTFSSIKEREGSAPVGSGAPTDTEYHWYIAAHQHVRKVDKDSYATFMRGLKYKLAHKRPHWHRWSDQRVRRGSERERTIVLLEATLARLKGEDAQASGFEEHRQARLIPLPLRGERASGLGPSDRR